MFAYLTIHTQHLKSRRKSIFTKPEVKACSVAGIKFGFSHSGPVVVYVVDRQKHRLGFTTTIANESAVSRENFCFSPLLIALGLFSFCGPKCGHFFWSTICNLPVTPFSRLLSGFFPICFSLIAHPLVYPFPVAFSVSCCCLTVFPLGIIMITVFRVLARCFHEIIDNMTFTEFTQFFSYCHQ